MRNRLFIVQLQNKVNRSPIAPVFPSTIFLASGWRSCGSVDDFMIPNRNVLIVDKVQIWSLLLCPRLFLLFANSWPVSNPPRISRISNLALSKPFCSILKWSQIHYTCVLRIKTREEDFKDLSVCCSSCFWFCNVTSRVITRNIDYKLRFLILIQAALK